MDQNVILGAVISALTVLLGLYVSVDKAFKKPISDLADRLQTMHEDFSVEMSRLAGRIEKNQENIDKNQQTLKLIQDQLATHETRITVLERGKENVK